jgi:hypothetical protein
MQQPRVNGAVRKDEISMKITITIRFADGQTVEIAVQPPP